MDQRAVRIKECELSKRWYLIYSSEGGRERCGEIAARPETQLAAPGEIAVRVTQLVKPAIPRRRARSI